MKFSIIVPVYNAERYLAECIESVLKQKYPDVELILVNDGSIDASGTICDTYQQINPGVVHVIHSVNQGTLMARLTGMNHASGEVLLFLDADDSFREDTLEILHHIFTTADCDMVIFNGSKENDYSRPYQKYPYSNSTLFDGVSKATLYQTLVSMNSFNNLCLKAVKRSVVDLNFDYSLFAHVRNGEDLLMSAQMMTNAQKIFILDQNLYYYRQHSESTVHSSQPFRAVSVKTVHLYLENLIDQWGMPELHPIHHAREVRGWIETLKISSRMEYASDFFASMAQDSYFRNAYEKMDKSCLKKRELFLAGLLYNRRFRLLREIWTLHRWVRSIKGLFHTF